MTFALSAELFILSRIFEGACVFAYPVAHSILSLGVSCGGYFLAMLLSLLYNCSERGIARKVQTHPRHAGQIFIRHSFLAAYLGKHKSICRPGERYNIYSSRRLLSFTSSGGRNFDRKIIHKGSFEITAQLRSQFVINFDLFPVKQPLSLKWCEINV